MTSPQRIHLPINRSNYPGCGALGHNYRCNRPRGHTGRHLFYWRHIDGEVREVW